MTPLSPTTAIATALFEHFERGGSNIDGVRLVELLELRGAGPLERSRGTRLASDWTPSPDCAAYAVQRGMTSARIQIETEKFRNYWTAKSGAGATKRDWEATWRNWIITATEQGNGPRNNGGQGPGTFNTSRRPPIGSDAVVAGMARLARRIDERRMPSGTGRAVSNNANPAGELDLGPCSAR